MDTRSTPHPPRSRPRAEAFPPAPPIDAELWLNSAQPIDLTSLRVKHFSQVSDLIIGATLGELLAVNV